MRRCVTGRAFRAPDAFRGNEEVRPVLSTRDGAPRKEWATARGAGCGPMAASLLCSCSGLALAFIALIVARELTQGIVRGRGAHDVSAADCRCLLVRPLRARCSPLSELASVQTGLAQPMSIGRVYMSAKSLHRATRRAALAAPARHNSQAHCNTKRAVSSRIDRLTPTLDDSAQECSIVFSSRRARTTPTRESSKPMLQIACFSPGQLASWAKQAKGE